MPPKLIVVKEPLNITAAQLDGVSPEEFEAGRKRYETQRQSRLQSGLEAVSAPRRPGNGPVLAHAVMPSDTHGNQVRTMLGGVLLKLMDSAAGITAVEYCRTNAVTASIDQLNFEAPAFLGNVIRIFAHPTFTSAKSLEVVVHAEAQDVISGRSWRCTSGHLSLIHI